MSNTPGGVGPGHPFLTRRVLVALAVAKRTWQLHSGGTFTDDDGPHLHHWVAILYVCQGCGAYDPPYEGDQ